MRKCNIWMIAFVFFASVGVPLFRWIVIALLVAIGVSKIIRFRHNRMAYKFHKSAYKDTKRKRK